MVAEVADVRTPSYSSSPQLSIDKMTETSARAVEERATNADSVDCEPKASDVQF